MLINILTPSQNLIVVTDNINIARNKKFYYFLLSIIKLQY